MEAHVLETNQQLFPGQRIKIKSSHPPYSLFNREGGTIIGFGQGDIVRVRPDNNLSMVLELYPHEIRDTNPPQEASSIIKQAIPELMQPA